MMQHKSSPSQLRQRRTLKETRKNTHWDRCVITALIARYKPTKSNTFIFIAIAEMFCLIDTSIRKTMYMHAHATGISNFRFQLTGLFLIFKKFICFNWHSRLQWPIFTLLPKDLRCFMMFWLASPHFFGIFAVMQFACVKSQWNFWGKDLYRLKRNEWIKVSVSYSLISGD